jgi:hypothetical protein
MQTRSGVRLSATREDVVGDLTPLSRLRGPCESQRLRGGDQVAEGGCRTLVSPYLALLIFANTGRAYLSPTPKLRNDS